jgi:hypothetical protein
LAEHGKMFCLSSGNLTIEQQAPCSRRREPTSSGPYNDTRHASTRSTNSVASARDGHDRAWRGEAINATSSVVPIPNVLHSRVWDHAGLIKQKLHRRIRRLARLLACNLVRDLLTGKEHADVREDWSTVFINAVFSSPDRADSNNGSPTACWATPPRAGYARRARRSFRCLRRAVPAGSVTLISGLLSGADSAALPAQRHNTRHYQEN